MGILLVFAPPPRPPHLTAWAPPPAPPPGGLRGSLTLSLWKGFKKLLLSSASSRGVPGGLLRAPRLLGELWEGGGEKC